MKQQLRIVALLALLVLPMGVMGQFTTPTINGSIGSGEYGNHTAGQNTAGNYFLTWDNTNLYVGVTSSNRAEATVFYLDTDPQTPINGGSNSNGNIGGFNYDGAQVSNLPFRANLVAYVKNDYREYRTSNGSGGWSSATSGFGAYSDNGSNVREFTIPWSVVGGRPSSFAFLGYVVSGSGFVYNQQPGENGGGFIGLSARYVRYFIVNSTADGSSIAPFSRNSYVFNSADDISSFGSIQVYDFTMNTSDRTLTRDASANWTISGNLVVGSGTLTFSNSTGTTAIGNLNQSGGTLSLSTGSGSLTTSGSITLSGGTLNTNDKLIVTSGQSFLNSGTTVNGNITFQRTLTGTAGWRLLSSPVNSSTYSSLLTNIWTQGADGADVSNGSPNVFWSESSSNSTLNATYLTDLTTTIPNGRGFALYVYNDDNYDAEGGTTWPKTLSVTGTENAVGATYTPAHGSGTQYAIGGNPFATTIDWDNVTKGADVANSVWVWNPGTSTYDAYNAGNGLLTGGLIAPFQGFWFQYTGASSGITFPAGAKSTGGTFRGKEAAPRRLVVRATDSEGSNQAWISFRDGATFGEDDFDAVKFTPLSADYIQLFTMVSDKAHDINSLPIDLVDALEIPLGVSSTRGGTVTLDLAELNLPIGWSASLRDNVTGETMAVDATFSYGFESSRAKAAPAGEATHVLAATDPRFTLIIDPSSSTSVDDGNQKPEIGFELAQNYPNPFNPSTQIRFTLRASHLARLTVYDILGREVAVLVNGVMPAGAHSVTFDASNLTSGVYMYKLEAGGMVMTKRMTLIK